MELRDYGKALRRYWRTWVGLTLAGALAALTVVLVAPRTYAATAQVFVASAGTGQSGWQFVAQRVTSYPDVAASRNVLEPVISELDLHESVTSLASRVSAVNPTGTSQIQLTVTDADPQRAADIANAVANRFGTVVTALEKPDAGTSPVALTVTTPASPPTTPSFPVPGLLLALGVVVGLLLGLATAVLRSSRDTRLHTGDDVRAAWGPDADELTVHAPVRRSRRGVLASRPATRLARQVEPLAAVGAVRVVALSPSRDQRSARSLLDELAGQLSTWSVPVQRREELLPSSGRAGRPTAELALGTPLAPLHEWRDLARAGACVVVVIEPGRVDAAELRELRSVFAATGVRPMAVVLQPRRGAKRTTGAVPATAAAQARTVAPRPQPVPVAADRG